MIGRFRALLALLALAAATVLVPLGAASPAQAAPWCDEEVPLPATPLTGGGFTTTPPNVSTGDPFADPSIALSNVYGWHYKMVTYDTGCTPGSSIMPGTGTQLANGITEPVGSMASMGHGLMSAVINPTWLAPVDEGVALGVAQVRAGTWFPYVGLVVLLIAVGMLWATRTGRLNSSATAGVWAVVVLGVTTYLGSYPLHATQMVDGAVQESAVLIAESFSTDPDEYGPPVPGDGAQEAIDRQYDALVRNTSYRTWSEGMLGSATSATARTYGPDLFKATHLSWEEAAALETDPEGAGQGILDAKADAFTQVVEQIESADPYAYSHVQGKHWGQRISTALAGLLAGVLVMLFLLVAPIGMFIGYVVIRVAVMFSPAAGLLFMFERMRGFAIGLVSKVGRYVVMGPLWLLGALVVLRLNSAILNAGMALWLKLLLCLVVSFVAWSLLRPVSGIPGARGVHRMVRTMATAWAGLRIGGAAKAVGDRARDEKEQDGTGDQGPVDEPRPERDEPVYTEPQRSVLPALSTRRSWSSNRGRQDQAGQDQVDWGEMPAQREQQTTESERSGRQRVALMGRPVGMSGRRVRHLSSSSAAGVAAAADGEQQLRTTGRAPGVILAPGDPREQHDAGEAATVPADQGAVQDGAAAGAAAAGGTFAPPPMPAPVLGAVDGPAATAAEDAPQESGFVAAGGSAGAGAPPVPVVGGAALAARQGDGIDRPHGSSMTQGDIPREEHPAEQPGTFIPSTHPRAVESGQPVEVAVAERDATDGTPRWIDAGVVLEEEDLPAEVHEANVTLGSDGKAVFQVYRPQGRSVVRRVDEP